MKMNLLLASLAVAALTMPVVAHADPGGKKGPHFEQRAQPKYPEDPFRNMIQSSDNTLLEILIGADDREIIRDYLREDSRRFCPPGLAKKHNGCLPPGQPRNMKSVTVMMVNMATYRMTCCVVCMHRTAIATPRLIPMSS